MPRKRDNVHYRFLFITVASKHRNTLTMLQIMECITNFLLPLSLPLSSTFSLFPTQNIKVWEERNLYSWIFDTEKADHIYTNISLKDKNLKSFWKISKPWNTRFACFTGTHIIIAYQYTSCSSKIELFKKLWDARRLRMFNAYFNIGNLKLYRLRFI